MSSCLCVSVCGRGPFVSCSHSADSGKGGISFFKKVFFVCLFLFCLFCYVAPKLNVSDIRRCKTRENYTEDGSDQFWLVRPEPWKPCKIATDREAFMWPQISQQQNCAGEDSDKVVKLIKSSQSKPMCIDIFFTS